MKKQSIITLLTLISLICILCVGCNNESAKKDYDNENKIASVSSVYSKVNYLLNQNENGCTLQCESFEGREDIWTYEAEEEQSVDVKINFTLTEGKCKIVMVDEDGNVSMLLECTPDTVTADEVIQSIILKSGNNRFRIIGYECKDIELCMELM